MPLPAAAVLAVSLVTAPVEIEARHVSFQGSATIMSLDVQAVAGAAAHGSFRISNVPLPRDDVVDLLVEPFAVTGPETRVVLAPWGKVLEPPKVTLLSGRVEGEAGSFVYLSLSPHGGTGWIELGPGRRRYQVSSRPGAGLALGPGELAVFETGPGIGPLLGVPVCGVEAKPQSPIPAGAGGPAPSMQQLQLAVEADYEFFVLFNDAFAASAYIIELYGAVSAIYMRDVTTRVELSFIRVWISPSDPYNEPDPLFCFVNHWNENMGDVTRDAAQLLSGRRDLPYGGVALLDSLCTTSAYSVAGYALGFFESMDSPGMGNWDIIVTAHELGHNCAARHTHELGIDGCAFGQVQRGTIMSYCHTTPGGNANIDLRFHTQLQESVQPFIVGASCVVADCNGNGVDDAEDISGGTSDDADANGVPDECEDCNGNGTLDSIDISGGASTDLNGNGIPDECEADCNGNSVPDDLDIELGTSPDANGNGVPDGCEEDCDTDGTSDLNEITMDMSLDIDRDAVLDACQDCDDDGITDMEALAGAHNVWVASMAKGVLSQYHATSGVWVATSDPGVLQQPHDIVIRPDGHILVSSGADNRVVELDADGAYLGDLVAAGLGGIVDPAGMLLTSQGTLLVASTGTDSVLEYDADTGAALGEFVGSGSGGLNGPLALSYGPNGNLFVSSTDGEVLEYDGSSGAFVGVFVSAADNGGLLWPTSLLFKPNENLLLASNGTNELLEYDAETGAFLGRWDYGGPSAGLWGLSDPWDLAFGRHGDVYATSQTGATAVHRYDVDSGAFMRSYYVFAVGGPLTMATGLAFVSGEGTDCNLNLVPDACDIDAGTSLDENGNGVPDECDVEIPGDLNGDGTVGIEDFLLLLAAWGACPEPCPPSCPADLDEDCDVGINDFLLLLANWTG